MDDDDDAYVPPPIDYISQRASALVTLAGAIDKTKNATARDHLLTMMERISRSFQTVPQAVLVGIEGGAVG